MTSTENVSSCQCGCGGQVRRVRQGNTKRGYKKGEFHRWLPGHNHKNRRRSGYPQLFRPDHPNAKGKGLVYEHVIVAECALGQLLPSAAEIHHVDGNSMNNAPGNLVICEDRAYHKLLHYRQRLVALGANTDTEGVCSFCRKIKLLEEFGAMRANKSTGRQRACRSCMNARRADLRKRAKLAAEYGVNVPEPNKVSF